MLDLQQLTPEEHAQLVALLLTRCAEWREALGEYLGVRWYLYIMPVTKEPVGYICRSAAEVQAALRGDGAAYDAAREELIDCYKRQP